MSLFVVSRYLSCRRSSSFIHYAVFGAFVTLVPVIGLSKVAEAHLVRHRTCLSDMMRPAAACQLAKMRDIDRRLAELSDQAQSMREENEYNSRRYAEIEEGEERCLAALQQLTQARPATRERYEDHLLQLVILARAQ